jgi:dolichol-phosphate mannosyltransferase
MPTSRTIPPTCRGLYAACKKVVPTWPSGRGTRRAGALPTGLPTALHFQKVASLYTWMITWMPISDPTAGFMCYKREVLETINLDEIRFVGYAFQIEMKFAAWKLGFKLKEVPIRFEDRKYGESKMNKGIIKEGVLGVLKLRWHSLFTNYRKRVKIING